MINYLKQYKNKTYEELVNSLIWFDNPLKLKAIFSKLYGVFIKDAPKDGKTYGRKDEEWSEITGGSGGSQDLNSVLTNGQFSDLGIFLNNPNGAVVLNPSTPLVVIADTQNNQTVLGSKDIYFSKTNIALTDIIQVYIKAELVDNNVIFQLPAKTAGTYVLATNETASSLRNGLMTTSDYKKLNDLENKNYPNDSVATASGVPVNSFYHTNGVLKINLNIA